MAGPGTNPLRDFLLHQQHKPLVGRIHRPVQSAHQPLQQWASDVVRDVGHHLVGDAAITQFQWGFENIALMEAEPRLSLKTFLKTIHQIAVELNRMHRLQPRGQQTLGQRPATGPHLKHPIGGLQVSSLDDSLQHGFVPQPVLTETLAGVMSGETHGSTVHQHSRSTSIQRIVRRDVIKGTRASLTRSSCSADAGCTALQQLIARAMRRRLAE